MARGTLSDTAHWHPVFTAGRQGRKVAALWAGAWLAGLACAWGGWAVWTADPGAEGALLAGLVWALGAAMPLGLEVVRRVYVSALDEGPDRSLRVLVHRWGRPRWIETPPGTLRAGPAKAGEWATGGMEGAAPWVPLRRPGHRLPFVLDLQGDVVDAAAFARLTRGQPGR